MLAQLDQAGRVGVAERKRLLVVDVLARRERRGGHLEVRLRDGQVDDRFDGVVGEHRRQVGVGAAAVLGTRPSARAPSRSVAPTSSNLRRRRDRLRIAAGDVAGPDERNPHRNHPPAAPASPGLRSGRGPPAHARRRARRRSRSARGAHGGLDVDDTAAPGAGLVRLALAEDVLQVHVRDVLAELLDRAPRRSAASPTSPCRRSLRASRRRRDLRQHLSRRALRVVFDRQRDPVLAQHRRERGDLAGEAASDDARAEGERELARAPDVPGADPGRVRRNGESVTRERVPQERDVLVGRPVGAQVRPRGRPPRTRARGRSASIRSP